MYRTVHVNRATAVRCGTRAAAAGPLASLDALDGTRRTTQGYWIAALPAAEVGAVRCGSG
jgi:hypothetical protein